MGKPKGRNGFFHYMQHKQNVLRQQGESLGLNSPRLQEIAGNEWKEMTKEQREPFDRRAKSEKDRSQQTIPIQPLNYNQRQGSGSARELVVESQRLNEEEDREQYLDKMIECCINACKETEDLINASFFVMSSNIMVNTDSNEWYPLEIGICQYTIKNGINFTYHQFIDAGKVPMGYMSQAKSWAEDSHKIPFENFYAASNNYQKIVEDIVQILENSRFTNEISGKPTPMLVYCNEDQIEQNKGVLKWLAKKYRSFAPTFEWDLEVLDSVNLLFHISNAVNKPIPPAIAEKYLTTSAFDYSAETNCDFHEEMDNKNCARGVARRYCYMFSEALLELFKISPTSDHLPPKRRVVADTYKLNLIEVKNTPANRYHSRQNDEPDDWAPTTSGEAQNRNEATSSQPPPKPMGIGRGRAWIRR